MTDRDISAGRMVAYGLWFTAVMLVGTAALLGPPWGLFAVLAMAAAVTATTRQYFVHQNTLMRSAFELGRDSTRDRVRNLH